MPIPLSESRDLSTANHYFPAMEHKHNNCEIILFVRGNPTNVANGRAEKMGIGDICSSARLQSMPYWTQAKATSIEISIFPWKSLKNYASISLIGNSSTISSIPRTQ